MRKLKIKKMIASSLILAVLIAELPGIKVCASEENAAIENSMAVTSSL